MALGVVKFLTSDRFINFLITLENYPTIIESLGSIQGTLSGKLICSCNYPQIFLTSKIMVLGKVKILIFLTVFLKVFDISRELPSRI